jgi:hypothetical protein
LLEGSGKALRKNIPTIREWPHYKTPKKHAAGTIEAKM